MSVEARLRESLVPHGRSLHERGLSPGSSGNGQRVGGARGA
jgi:hypothetical protein